MLNISSASRLTIKGLTVDDLPLLEWRIMKKSIFDKSIQQSEDVTCSYLSDATLEECESLIGKVVERVDASEYAFLITFTDGTTCETTGNRWGDCGMGVYVTKGDK